MSDLSKKSILARLLATENLAVEQGNFQTAWFEPKSRRLGLPMWPNISKDMYDLMVGHEVGHALETPADGWHNADTEIPGCPKSFLNIIEDIRIEKLILRRYPGLVGNFKRGYGEFLARDFFGIKEKDINTLYFMDRLNIKAKARDLVTVPFTDEEMPFVTKAFAVETWEDVIKVTREIYEWLKSRNQMVKDMPQGDIRGEMSIDVTKAEFDEMMKNAELSDDEGEGGMTVKVNIIDADEGEGKDGDEDGSSGSKEGQEEGSSGGDEGDTEGKGKGSEKSEKEGDKQSEEKSKDGKTQGGNGHGDGQVGDGWNPNIEKVLTDEMFRVNEKTLSDSVSGGGKTVYVRGMSKAEVKAIVSPYADVVVGRKQRKSNWYASYGSPKRPDFPKEKLDKFMSEQKPIVANMVKEFEMRKAAYRSARARTSTKGSLDVNKLHSYKFNDHIFKQYTTLADGKNHGMVMLIDYSGSMSGVIGKVIEQTLTLVMFCKRVGIPFTVYGFSTANGNKANNIKRVADNMHTSIEYSPCSLFELIASDMTKAVYKDAFENLFAQTTDDYWFGTMESLGSTPLNLSLIAMHHIIDDFRKKHRVQKMNFITLTDGDSDGMYATYGRDIDNRSKAYGKKHKMEIFGKLVELSFNSRDTDALIQSIRDMDVAVINYYLGGSSIHYKANYKDSAAADKAKSEVRRDGFTVVDNDHGYTRRFLINTGNRNMFGEIEEFEIDDDATTSKIAKEFSKHSQSKKYARIVSQKFAEIVS